jgi:hypothetical protein
MQNCRGWCSSLLTLCAARTPPPKQAERCHADADGCHPAITQERRTANACWARVRKPVQGHAGARDVEQDAT